MSSAYLLAEVFFFSILKPCWLPGHRLPASWSVVFYFLQVLLLTGVCCFVTHWLASSKNPPSLHHAQKVFSLIWSIHFARFFFRTCTHEHTDTVTLSPNNCCTRKQKEKKRFVFSWQGIVSTKEKANCTSLEPCAEMNAGWQQAKWVFCSPPPG